ncbi:MAG: hypothetical protein ACJ73S_04030 [Mycobacteriales bacterium]
MSEVAEPAGGFLGDPAEAFEVASTGGGCCGTSPEGGCCGTTDAGTTDAGDGCCTPEAKADAVASGAGCCG